MYTVNLYWMAAAGIVAVWLVVEYMLELRRWRRYTRAIVNAFGHSCPMHYRVTLTRKQLLSRIGTARPYYFDGALIILTETGVLEEVDGNYGLVWQREAGMPIAVAAPPPEKLVPAVREVPIREEEEALTA